jgi:hypothetical protein
VTYGLRLAEAVWGVYQDALHVYADDGQATAHLRRHLGRLEEPVRIAVTGPWRAGKSTALNAIMGEEVAPIGADDGGRAFTWYEDGPRPRATAYPSAGPPQELVVTRSATGLRVDLVGWRSGEIDDIVVQWPTRALRQATFIDTPPVGGPGENGTSPVMDRVLRDADAVLYLTRDGRDTDLRALGPVRDSAVGQAAPVNVLLVLSRADEVGGGRVDALLAARQLARRQLRDPRVGASCVESVALSGTIGLAGRVMSESDFTALAALSTVARPELDGALLSADRFVRGELSVRLDHEVRAALLDRFGLFGLRLATTLIRAGADSRTKLSAELIRRGGLTELRGAIARFFIDRADVLKARSALAALESLVRTVRRPGSLDLLAAVEQILAGAHDFRELRLLAALRDARLGFPAELATEAYRLVGGGGVGLTARLGLDHDGSTDQLWGAASDALWRWQDRTEDPLLRRAQQQAARVVARSCEGILAELAEGNR